MPTVLENETALDRRPRLKLVCRQLQDLAEELGPEGKLPTLVELRQQLGVSMQTLSDALRELEKRNVLVTVHGVGIYVTGHKNRVLTNNVGFMIPYDLQPEQNVTYWGSVIAGMRSAAYERNYDLLLIDNRIRFSRWEKIDGVILCESHNLSSVVQHPPYNFPCISILNKIAKAACVTTDDNDGAYQLTQSLIKLGHRRIAYLATFNTEKLNQRREGYLRALAEAGIEYDSRFMRELNYRDEWDELTSCYLAAGQYYTARWLAEDWKQLGCTALMAQNDETARGAIRAFEAAGISVPGEVSVTGFDGLPSYHATQQLTTIQVPLFKIGEQAMRSLLDWIQDPQRSPQDICLPVHFVNGETVGPIAI